MPISNEALEKYNKRKQARDDFTARMACVDKELKKIAKMQSDIYQAKARFKKLLADLIPAGTEIEYQYAMRNGRLRRCTVLDWNDDFTLCISYTQNGDITEKATIDRIVRILRTPDGKSIDN